MDRIQKIKTLIDILQEIEYPNDAIKPVIIDKCERLYILMWEKTDAYTGPLFDGFQKTDLPVITVLLGNWLMESYIDVMKNKQILKKDLDDFYNKTFITGFSIQLFKGIVSHDMIEGIGLADLEVFERLHDFIESDMQDILNLAEQLLIGRCCGCFGNKNASKKLQEMSDNKGNDISNATNSSAEKV